MDKRKILSKVTSGSGTPLQSSAATVSTAAKPPTIQQGHGIDPAHAAEDAPRNAADGGSGDEWIEVEEIDEAEKLDMDDEMSEPSLGLGDNQNANEIEEVSAIDMPKRAGKRKITGAAVGKAKVKKTRAKRSKCWQYFKEVKAISKKHPGVVVPKAKCLYCCDLFAYATGSTTSLNRHIGHCPVILN